MPRNRKNKRRGNSARTINSDSQQSSRDAEEPSGGETENTTMPSDGEIENSTHNVETDGSVIAEASASSGTESLSDAFGGVDDSAAALARDIESLIDDYGRRMRLLSDRKVHLLETTEKVKKDFDIRLKKLHTELADQVNQTYQEEKKRIDAKMQKCVALKAEMEKAKMLTEKAIESNDPIDIITSYNKGTEAIKATYDTIDEMRQDHTTLRITHEFDTSPENFARNGLNLGTIKVTREKREFPVDPVKGDLLLD